MRIDELTAPDGTWSGRFFLVGVVPAAAATWFVLLLVWAGAPERPVRFADAWETAAALTPVQLVLLGFGVLLAAVVLHPLQHFLIGPLAGRWPRWLSPLTRLALRWQRRRYRRLSARAELPEGPLPQISAADVQRIGAAGTLLRQRFPHAGRLRATALGNALAAAWESRRYGWEVAVAWPRLYPLLGTGVRSLVDDRRNVLDTACRMAVTAAATGLASLILLARSGWWRSLALIPLAVAVLAYRAAVHAAVLLGQAIQLAFDLHRFDLMAALRLPLPGDAAAERQIAQSWCDWWRQGAPPGGAYEHSAQTN